MPGLQGLSRYGQSQGQSFNDVREQAMTGAEEGPINVLATITPDSLTKMMQRMGQGVGAGAQPAQEPSSTVGGGLQKAGDKPLAEQQKFLGTNKAGFQSMDKYRDVFMPGSTHVQENFNEANKGTNLALNAILPGSGWIKQMFD